MTANALRDALRLYLIADAGLVPPDRMPGVVRSAIAGGVTIVQLRAKRLTARAQVDLARSLRTVCDEARVPLIVNDRADVASAAGAAGAHVGHVGQEDLLPSEVLGILGPQAIVGVSVGSAEEAARVRDAAYLSAGPMYATTTKDDAGPAAGPDLVRAIRRVTTLPLVAIGGITHDRVRELVAAGADGVCVASAILRAADPRAAAAAFASELGIRTTGGG
ncbi:MAG: thiamine phosphate synthase [Chloroflexota bacterium]|nr:thiamine phosphate synthase [Chloroflexota bacterium]MDE3193822.1 thiamine phosphate synthase [Chloroflexota bacterium]